jgi:hypothetical protein
MRVFSVPLGCENLCVLQRISSLVVQSSQNEGVIIRVVEKAGELVVCLGLACARARVQPMAAGIGESFGEIRTIFIQGKEIIYEQI